MNETIAHRSFKQHCNAVRTIIQNVTDVELDFFVVISPCRLL